MQGIRPAPTAFRGLAVDPGPSGLVGPSRILAPHACCEATLRPPAHPLDDVPTALDHAGSGHPPLRVLHSDAQLLAVDKPAGLLVHRSALDAHADTDLLTLLRARGQGPLWPVHRLDKGTSGVLLLARDADSARRLGAAFARPAAQAHGAGVDAAAAPDDDNASKGSVHKHYLALVRGWPPAAGQTAQPLARDPELPSTGQALLPAATYWQVLAQISLPLATAPCHADTRLALLRVQPLSGRRHQIRRHFKQLAHPLIGDATHGKGPLNRAVAAHIGLARLWLHAWTLTVPHPSDGQPITLRAPPGPEWAPWLDAADPAALRDAVAGPTAAP